MVPYDVNFLVHGFPSFFLSWPWEIILIFSLNVYKAMHVEWNNLSTG